MSIIKKFPFLILITLLFFASCKKHRVRPNYAMNLQKSHVKVAKSMSELDKLSKNTKPTMIYSYPALKLQNNLIARDKFKLLSYINRVRARGTVCAPPAPPLGWNNKLEMAALSHAIDMRTNKFLAHLGSGSEYDVARKGPGQGSNFYERILHFGYPIQPSELAGEILSYTKYKIVGTKDVKVAFEHAVDNFLKSPAHCGIISNPRFHDVGIAAYSDNEKIYWVIEFAEVNY